MKSKVLLPLIATVLIAAGCQKSTVTEATNTSESRSESGFREINAGGAVSLIVAVGGDFSVTVEGNADLLREVTTSVSDGTLVVKTSGKISQTNKPRMTISMPELRSLEIWGSSTATVTNTSGEFLRLQSGGSSSVSIDGQTASAEIVATGSGKIDAEGLRCKTAVVNASGASTVTLFVTDELEAESLGASNVLYLGKPKIVKRNIVGAGEIREK